MLELGYKYKNLEGNVPSTPWGVGEAHVSSALFILCAAQVTGTGSEQTLQKMTHS